MKERFRTWARTEQERQNSGGKADSTGCPLRSDSRKEKSQQGQGQRRGEGRQYLPEEKHREASALTGGARRHGALNDDADSLTENRHHIAGLPLG